MKILLIKPPTSEKQLPGDDLFMSEPLELEYVAAGVSDKYEVRILDMRLEPSLEKHLEEYAPDIVGITSYTPQVYIAKDILKKVKANRPGILTVVGGHHATMAPQDFCDPDIDIIVMGEGVFTFREIVERFDNKQDVKEVKGIAFSQNGGLTFTEPREYPDLDSFPFPNRVLTGHYRENYFLETSDGLFKPLATLRTSKGCPYRCKFCALWKITKGKYLTRSPEAILEELKSIKEPYIDFADDETFIDLKRMHKLADLILDSGIKKLFSSAVRSDTVVENPDFFKKWRKAGLERVLIGMESNRPKDLEYLRKQNTTGNNEKAVSILRKMGVKIDASFIIPPDYDIEDFDNLANYAKNLKAEFVMCIPLTPLPGTDLYEEVKDQLTTSNLELFDLSHAVLPTRLPLKKFYRELTYLYYRINKSLAGKYDQSHIRKFMKLHKAIKHRHLHHQPH
jgi:radical SAM superfamily enzyme YgiQ (UPF0313 family)